jgi:hypothetical protein
MSVCWRTERRFPAAQRLLDVVPRLEHERPRGAVLRLGVAERVEERVALGLGAGLPGLGRDEADQLVEQPAAHAEGPARVADRRDAGDPHRMDVAAPVRSLGDCEVPPLRPCSRAHADTAW